ncbi:MAG TPA: biotin/lipoyl-containing protein [Baekduia sp.]|nr:biotin/lipoyl-containing protein [Baekduia sp.]
MSARVEILIEDPGNTEEVEVVAIEVAVGDAVAAGQALLEVATDKANMELEAPVAGTVAEILVSEGDIVPVTQLLMVLEP